MKSKHTKVPKPSAGIEVYCLAVFLLNALFIAYFYIKHFYLKILYFSNPASDLSTFQRFHEFLALIVGLIVGEFIASPVLGLPYWLALLVAYKKSKIAYYGLCLIEFTSFLEIVGCFIHFNYEFIEIFFIFEFLKFILIGISIYCMRREARP
jgi:hypothetical protein